MQLLNRLTRPDHVENARRGAFMVLAFFCLTVCLAFVALSVDVGYLSLTKTRMQNAVDTAALAAAQEIINAVHEAPSDAQDVTQFALGQARLMAAQVAELNGVHVNPQTDVRFGRRSYDPGTGSFTVTWDATPANVVRVTARRDNADASQPDGKLPLFFAGVIGDRYAQIRTNAIALVEARDLVVVHDFSRSMNFDSHFSNEVSLQPSDEQIVENLQIAFDDLNPPAGELAFEPQYLSVTKQQDGGQATVTFKFDKVDVTASGQILAVTLKFDNGLTQTHPGTGSSSGTYQGTGPWYSGRDITNVDVTFLPGDEGTPVTIVGAEPTHGCEPQIEVTFSGDGKTIEVTSDKDLSNVVLAFENGHHYKFDGLTGLTGTFSGTGSYSGMTITTAWIKSGCNHSSDGPGYGERFDAPSGMAEPITLAFDDSYETVKAAFGLNEIPYPFPGHVSYRGQTGWNAYIEYTRHPAGNNANSNNNHPLVTRGYREMYGGLTMMNYFLHRQAGHQRTPEFWKVRHYPFHAIKEGHELFCNFLQGLEFGDHLGMVSYDTSHRVEMVLNESDPDIPFVDISSGPITNEYAAINNLMKYKQAGHYSYATNMGGGLKDAVWLLDNHSRPGARPTILLMTDGNTNTISPGEDTSLPPGWNWDELFDYNGDGTRNYFTSSVQKQYVLKLAKEAVDKGYMIHTMSVGADADTELMEAVAHLGSGQWLNVPGGMSVVDMEAEVLAAFHKIATFVPPAKLMANPDENP
jgi:Flp pilus assembly protein TadG